ncbi:MAG: outer membrane protein assembly factor BamE [Thermodesulfovibrionales bacterium]|nr:outer membrane protein assembly factor BamE [Nitrospinota bacterium]MCG2709052.1 outer membrane protein assembly factor BamE [Thermodesulfovibrionales bacterium]
MPALCIMTSVLCFSVLGCIDSVRYSPDEIKGFPPAIQENIKRGEIAPGMTQQQVRYAWGSPAEVNVLKPSEDNKYREEWVYTRSGILKTRLIFIDGKLMHIISNEPGVIKK